MRSKKKKTIKQGKKTSKNGGIAQLGEHLPCKQGVRSSNLLVSTKKQQKKNIHSTKKLLKQITIKSTKYSSTMKTAYHQKNIALDIKDRKTTTAY